LSYFVFDGFRSDTAGIFVERRHTLSLPQRDVEKIHVPGRNGDVLIDHGSYQNAKVSYDCAAKNISALENMKAALASGSGYRLLTDSYSPLQRMALFASTLEIDELILNRAMRFTVTFDCKPQRWFDRNAAITMTSPGTILAPAGAHGAQPVITINGSGSVILTINSTNYTIPGVQNQAVVDSEAQVAYKTVNGTRQAIDVSAFPVFPGADVALSWSGTVSSIKFQPQWYCL
jgi:phage-related protein